MPFSLLVDPHREAYRAYGLGTGRLTQIFAPSSAAPFLVNNFRAETRQRGLKGGKFLQMPGTFVVDTAGIVRVAHRNRTIADSPSTDALLAGLAPATARGPVRGGVGGNTSTRMSP
jgi:peroxiredoxin